MGIKILLADDSLTAQNMGKKILSEAGHEVVTVSNGAAAAKKIAEIKPELVLLDVFMPGYSGLELCEKLRKAADTAKLPVLLTVGKMEPYSPQEGARVKADGVIIKPFEASDLMAAVDRLAQKLKPASAPAPSHESTMKVASPAEFKDESYLAWKQDAPIEGEEAGSTSASKPPSSAYEQTMRLDASQIAAMLKVGKPEQPAAEPAHAAEFNVAAPAYAEEEFSVAPPPPSVSAESESSAPAFGSELADTTRSEVPSYMAQYLADQTNDLLVTPAASTSAPAEHTEAKIPAFETAFASEVAYSSADAPTVVLPKESVVQHFASPTTAEPATASAEGLELTAAAPVADVPLVKEAGLEPTHHASDAPTIMLPDPAFVSDPHSSTMDFVTQFGTGESGLAEQLLQSMGSSSGEKPSEDDFESRLNAAMTAFEAPPAELSTAAEPSLPSALIEMPGAALEVTAEPAPFLISAELSAGEDLPTISAGPETVAENVPAAQAEEELPVLSAHSATTHEVAIEALPSPTPEFAAAEPQEEPAPADAVSSTVIAEPETSLSAISMEVAPPETDDAVIRQMREAFSDLPVDHSHVEHAGSEHEPEPMAMAAAASAAPAAVPAPPAIAREAELEIARALSAAVGAETPSNVTSIAATAETTPGSDANSVAAAVENVMRRELPNLVWKIMAELDQRKRS